MAAQRLGSRPDPEIFGSRLIVAQLSVQYSRPNLAAVPPYRTLPPVRTWTVTAFQTLSPASDTCRTSVYSDPDPWNERVLYVHHTIRDKQAPGGARFGPELVNNRFGVGSHFVLTDMNGDGRTDIVTFENLGTFVFLNQMKKRVKR